MHRLDQSVTARLRQSSVRSSRSSSPHTYTFGRTPSPSQLPVRALTPYSALHADDEAWPFHTAHEEDVYASIVGLDDYQGRSPSPLFTPSRSLTPQNSSVPRAPAREVPRSPKEREDPTDYTRFHPPARTPSPVFVSDLYESAAPHLNPEKRVKLNDSGPKLLLDKGKDALPGTYARAWYEARNDFEYHLDVARTSIREERALSSRSTTDSDQEGDLVRSFSKVQAWNETTNDYSKVDARPRLTPRELKERNLSITPRVGIPNPDTVRPKPRFFYYKSDPRPLETAPKLPAVAPPAPLSTNLVRELPKKPEVIRIVDSRGNQKVIRPKPNPHFVQHPEAVDNKIWRQIVERHRLPTVQELGPVLPKFIPVSQSSLVTQQSQRGLSKAQFDKLYNNIDNLTKGRFRRKWTHNVLENLEACREHVGYLRSLWHTRGSNVNIVEDRRIQKTLDEIEAAKSKNRGSNTAGLVAYEIIRICDRNFDNFVLPY